MGGGGGVKSPVWTIHVKYLQDKILYAILKDTDITRVHFLWDSMWS